MVVVRESSAIITLFADGYRYMPQNRRLKLEPGWYDRAAKRSCPTPRVSSGTTSAPSQYVTQFFGLEKLTGSIADILKTRCRWPSPTRNGSLSRKDLPLFPKPSNWAHSTFNSSTLIAFECKSQTLRIVLWYTPRPTQIVPQT
jgi:hypothetical protein